MLSYRRGYSPLGTLAFPGGSVENTDDAEVDWVGPDPTTWARMLSIDDPAAARRHVVAAAREAFEETGLLLATDRPNNLVEGTDSADWMRQRQALASQDITFAELLARRGLALRSDLLRPVLHWISPEFALRRFNTRYFVAVALTAQTPRALEGKPSWVGWVRAADAIRQLHQSTVGDAVGHENTVGKPLDQLLNSGTVSILQTLAQARGCIAYLNRPTKARAYQPRLVVEGERVWLEVETPNSATGRWRQR